MDEATSALAALLVDSPRFEPEGLRYLAGSGLPDLDDDERNGPILARLAGLKAKVGPGLALKAARRLIEDVKGPPRAGGGGEVF